MNDLKLFRIDRFGDERGYFAETYSRNKYFNLGVEYDFVQDNHSISKYTNTLRGLHFQAPPYAQGKLVRCGRGAIFDVAVDIRKGSSSYGEWKAFEITADNGEQLFIPPGFAHGFLTLEKNSEIIYKCTDYYSPKAEGSINWNDPDIGITWPLKGSPLLSDKDKSAPLLCEFDSPFIYGVNL